MTLTTVARQTAKATLIPLGWPGRRRPGDVVVLLYHRVGDGGSEIELPRAVFEDHLRYLTARERVLAVDDVLDGDRGGGVVVTFDDGSPDFHETVVPLLERYRVPATLYLATGLVANGHGTSGNALTWSQLASAVGTGLVTVGSHTHGHTDLSRASETEAESEMRRSKELIEDHLSVRCDHFAYPWAVGGPAADRVARRLFRSAALDAWRTNRAGRTDPHRIGRVPILKSDGRFFFRRKVHGELDTEAWLYRALGRGPWGRG